MRGIILQKHYKGRKKDKIDSNLRKVTMIYSVNDHGQKIFAGFAPCHYSGNRNFPRLDGILICILLPTSHKYSCCESDSNGISSSNPRCIPRRIDRLDHVDGSRYCADRCPACSIQAFDVDKVDFIPS